MTRDRIPQEPAQRQKSLIVAVDWPSRERANSWADELDSLASAVNHARLNGSAQLLVNIPFTEYPPGPSQKRLLWAFNADTRAILKTLSGPAERLTLLPPTDAGVNLLVAVITCKQRKKKKG